ncbi:GNAT family N-acetyltransferase [Janthinobacterium sp. PC23-8]|uniref:GNAT family N-acetyltransferase n=1 Tax=Janthinobacterium sp. PC23-8 TaxID=2012679 RepID=UPI000B96F3A2|nr:GNAT family N-acetyltransferase [Janthinobacterium sp. PC23-8]OYO31657.1 GNAT family N-acetyltransferase [Janthinobacterium sp. PC23-8]
MITWQWHTFDELGPRGLYQVLALRQRVFVLEQQCLYQDLDGHDQAAMHLLGWQEVDGRPQLAAYLRVLAPGAKYGEMSLGRVLTAPEARTTGAGKQLLLEGIARAVRLHPGHAIRIGAQQYLERFYQCFGFVTVSAPYDEDGIQHIDMLRPAEAVAP